MIDSFQPMAPLWQIELLGGLRVRSHAETITRFRTQKTALLLAYLALHPQRAHPRELLAEMLWSGSESAAGRLNLRAELASLRRQLEPPGVPRGSVLLTDHSSVQLSPGAAGTDVAAFQAALQQAAGMGDPKRRIEALRRAVQCYGGELLLGFYEEWILLERTRLAELYLVGLRELSGLLYETGDPDGAIEIACRAVATDPLSEEARFGLIRLYAAAGRPADALRQYQELEQSLREALGQEPSTAVRQFAAHLARSSAPISANGHGPALPPRRTAPRPTGAAAAQTPRPRLPLTLSRFFDREAEFARLQELLLGEAVDGGRQTGDGSGNNLSPPGYRLPSAACRLVTLTGPGGSGKTRMAIEAARRLSAAFGDAIWFVPLADRADPALIGDALAEALHLPRSAEIDPVDQAAGVLGRRPSLLIVDNMEHLLEGGREIVTRLLGQAPALTCLVTSRQRLDLDGEREILIAPLPVPVDGSWLMVDRTAKAGLPDPSTIGHQPSALAHCPSIQLFVDRAQAVRPDFQVTPRNAGAVAALCARLEGLPLAIELAAAWARTLTPEQMLAHLEGGAALLVSRRRDASPRHHSLHAAMEWSYRLLDPVLQQFFARLAVFRGSWDLEAAQAVCGSAGVRGQESGVSPTELPLPELTSDPRPLTPDALSLIAALQDRSLVVAEVVGGTMSYRLLETLREFAREQLSEAEWSELVRRHAAYYLALAEKAEPQLGGARQREWAERLRVEEPNMQAALERSVGSEEGVRLAVALTPYWEWRGHLRAGRERLERMLTACPGAPPDRWAKAVFGAAALACLCGDTAGAGRLLQEGLRYCRRLASTAAIAAALQPLTTPHLHLSISASLLEHLGLFEALMHGHEDRRVQAFLLAREGKEAWVGGEYATAIERAERSLTIYQELGDQRGIGTLLWLRGSIARYQGDEEAAWRYWEASLETFRELEDQTGVCQLTGALGYLAFRRAEYDPAETLAEEALALNRRMSCRDGIAGCLWLLGRIVCCRGRYQEAAGLLEESLQIRRVIGSPSATADTLIALGLVAHARADYPRARALLHEALDLRRRETDLLDVADALYSLGLVALAERCHVEAEGLLCEGLDLAHQMQNDRTAGRCLCELGLIACRQGDLARADERLRESMALLSRTADRISMAEGQESLAELRLRQERAEEATSLYAKADALRQAIGAPLPPCDQPRYTRALASLRASLGPARFAALWEEARAAATGEALLSALEPAA